jgi:hypothetical protein
LIQIGSNVNNKVLHIGISSIILQLLLSGRSFFGNNLFIYKKINLFTNNNINIYNQLIDQYIIDINSDSLLYNYIGIISEKKNKINNILYLLNTLDITDKLINYNIIIYQGTHFVSDSSKANLILPVASFVEDSLLYINIQGFFQKTNKALNIMYNIRTNIFILNMLLKELKIDISFFSYFNFLLGALNNINFITKEFVLNNYIYYDFFIINPKELHNIFCLSSKFIITEYYIKNKKNEFFYE